MQVIRRWGRGRVAGLCLGALLVGASVAQVSTASAGYVIQPGDTLSGIANTYGVSVQDLADVNDIANPDLIVSGAVLAIPGQSGIAPDTSTTQATQQVATYLVVSGDSIPTIAAQYDLTPSELADANDIPYPWLIYPGDVLVLPGVSTSAPAPSSAADLPQGGTSGSGTVYVVQAGDSIPTIAAAYGLTPGEVAQLNDIPYPWLIYPGDELLLPVDALPVGESAQGGNISAQDPYTGDVLDYDLPYYTHDEIRSMIVEISSMYNWNPYLIMAQAWWESGWNQQTVSYANAIGIMQILPSTAADAGPYLLGREVDIFNSGWDNIELGVAYLEHLYQQTGSEYLALAAYYQGLYSVENDGLFPETYVYVDGILALRDSFASGQLP